MIAKVFADGIGKIMAVVVLMVLDGIGKIIAGVILMILVENEVEEVVVEVVLVDVVEMRFMVFSQNSSITGRKFELYLPAFTQPQPLHKPVLLHLQHTIFNYLNYVANNDHHKINRLYKPL